MNKILDYVGPIGCVALLGWFGIGMFNAIVNALQDIARTLPGFLISSSIAFLYHSLSIHLHNQLARFCGSFILSHMKGNARLLDPANLLLENRKAEHVSRNRHSDQSNH